MSRAPDFFVVGAPKAATSSIDVLLRSHPGIFVSVPKEPHFFCTDLPGLAEVSDRAGYDALFADAPADALWGEASAFYLTSETAADEIRKANADAKIIMCLREPVAASISWYHQLRDGFREDQQTFAASWQLQEARAEGRKLPPYCPEPAQLNYLRIYSYARQVKRYLDAFPREQLLILDFDEVAGSSQEAGRKILTFLGVDPDQSTSSSVGKTNTRRTARFPRLVQFVSSPPRFVRPLVSPVKAVLNRLGIQPSVIAMKFLSRPATASDGGKSTVDAEIRAQAAAAFRPSVEALAQLLGDAAPAWARRIDAD